MKRLIGISALVLLALSGCASSIDKTATPGSFDAGEIHVKIADGRTITCITYKSGVSCDWTSR